MKLNLTLKGELVKLAIEAYRKAMMNYEYSHGAVQMFIKINEDWGAKFSKPDSYFTQVKHHQTYVNQRRASRHRLGPLTSGVFKFNYMGQTVYGYITEIVQTVTEEEMYFCYQQGAKRNEEACEVIENLYVLTGFKFSDCHVRNFGRTKDGKLVCIDFDGVNQSLFPEVVHNLAKLEELREKQLT